MDREVELREFVSARGAALSRAAYLLTGDHQEGGAHQQRDARGGQRREGAWHELGIRSRVVLSLADGARPVPRATLSEHG